MEGDWKVRGSDVSHGVFSYWLGIHLKALPHSSPISLGLGDSLQVYLFGDSS